MNKKPPKRELHTTLPEEPMEHLLTRDLLAVLKEPAIRAPLVEQILCVLVWLPLLGSRELAQVCRHKEHAIRRALTRMEHLKLLDSVPCDEPGTASRHRRLYVTDLGLYALAALYHEGPWRMSVPRLSQGYPVSRPDLLSRLAHLPIHLALAHLVSRLVGQCPPGYRVRSYQQPYQQRYTTRNDHHLLRVDAAFLLDVPDGSTHAFYVRVDLAETLFERKEEQAFLSRLLELRTAASLSDEVVPHLLIVSTRARFSGWADLLTQVCTLDGRTLVRGAIVDGDELEQGVYEPIWLELCTLVVEAPARSAPKAARRVSLLALCDQPAGETVIERFSGALSFATLLLTGETEAETRAKERLPIFVRESLLQEAQRLCATSRTEIPVIAEEVADDLAGSHAEQTRMTALLILVLTAPQKRIIAVLARHPYLSLPDLHTHLQETRPDIRLTARQLVRLCDLGLVERVVWQTGERLRTGERYHLTETGLRYLAVRHHQSAGHYLCPPEKKQPSPSDEEGMETPPKRKKPKARRLMQQCGAELLRVQMPHTHGVYEAVRAITLAGRATGRYEIRDWRSARESERWHLDVLGNDRVYARPDAELWYTTPTHPFPRSLLVEYDRGTSRMREYTNKFAAYRQYQDVTRTLLPPIVMIVERPKAARLIDWAIHKMRAEALAVILLLEAEVKRSGLVNILAQLVQNGLPP